MRLPQARLDQVLDRFHEVEARLGAATDGAEIVRLSQEHAEIKPVADAVQGLARVRAEIADLEAMAADPEMAEMAAEELEALTDRLPDLEREVALLLAPRDADENASAAISAISGSAAMASRSAISARVLASAMTASATGFISACSLDRRTIS